MQSITAKRDLQILHGKYYLCNKVWYHATENNEESSGLVLLLLPSHVLQNELFPAFVSHEYFTLTTGEAVYSKESC